MDKILKSVIKLLCETSYLYFPFTSDVCDRRWLRDCTVTAANVQCAARAEIIAQASCVFHLDRGFDIEMAGFLCLQA